MEQLGLEVRRLSHMKSAVRPTVKMKLKQHWQQPPPLDPMFGLDRWSFRENDDEEEQEEEEDKSRIERVKGT